MGDVALFLFVLGWSAVVAYLSFKRLRWLFEPTVYPGEAALPLPARREQAPLVLQQIRFGGALPAPTDLYGEHMVRAGAVSETRTDRYEVRHTELLADLRWVKPIGHLVEVVSPELLLLEFCLPSLEQPGEQEARWLGPAHRLRDIELKREDRQCGLAGENGRLSVVYWGKQRARASVVAFAIHLAEQLGVEQLVPAMGRPELRSVAPEGEEISWRCPSCGAPGPAGATCHSCSVTLVSGALGELGEGSVLPRPEKIRRVATARGEQVLSRSLELLAPHQIPVVLIGEPPRICVFEQDRARAKMLLRALADEGTWD